MTTAPALPAGSLIEALFRPSTRYRGRLPEGFTEVELLPGLTIENVLATGITWEDFRLFCRDKVVWMTPGVYLSFHYDAGDPTVLSLGGDVVGILITNLYVHVTRGLAVQQRRRPATFWCASWQPVTSATFA
jgi:hypothetical protein